MTTYFNHNESSTTAEILSLPTLEIEIDEGKCRTCCMKIGVIIQKIDD